jgi:type 1 glutamine amidotransferase
MQVTKAVKIILILIIVVIVSYVGKCTYQTEVLIAPTFEEIRPTLRPMNSDVKILVVSKTNGFRHFEAIPAANEMLEKLSMENNWDSIFTENGAVHNIEQLNLFDVIIWNNVSKNILTDEQQNVFKEYINNGGQWFGLHGSAGSANHPWEWYIDDFVNADFLAHPLLKQFQAADVLFNSQSPLATNLPEKWSHRDEWYSFKSAPDKADIEVIAWLDESTYDVPDKLKMGVHPIIWRRPHGNGNMVYSAIGHTAESYSDKTYIQFVENTIFWLSSAGRNKP